MEESIMILYNLHVRKLQNAKTPQEAIQAAEKLCKNHTITLTNGHKIIGYLGFGTYVLRKGQKTVLLSRLRALNLVRAHHRNPLYLRKLHRMTDLIDPLATHRFVPDFK